MIKNSKISLFHILLGFILILGFSLRLKGFWTNPSFWLDESALGWNILNKHYIDFFGKLRFLQISPPMFLIFTKFLVFITDGYNHVFRCDLVLRTLPFIFGNLSMIVFWFVCKKLFKSKWAALAGLTFIALNPVLINYSFEFKPYSLDLFCSLIALLMFLSIDFKLMNLKQIITYGLILSVLPLFSFASTFVIFAGFLALSFQKENPKLFTAFLALPSAAAFLYLNTFILKLYSQNSEGMLNYWQNSFVKKDFSNIFQLINDNFNYFFLNIPHFDYTLAFICAATGFIIFFKNSEFLYIKISSLTFAALIAASIFKLYPFSTRMILLLIPMLIIFIVKITDFKKCFIGAILSAILIFPHFIFAFEFLNAANIHKNDFARNMMNVLSANIYPEDIIILNDTSYADYFYYNSFYKLKNKIEFINPNYTKGETNKLLFDRLKKGKYIMFLSYDSNPNQKNIKEIKSRAYQKAQVLYEINTTQSTLMWLIIH